MKLVHQDHTKCPHCGHTYSELYFEFDYVDRYKSGPRKGQVKTARQEKAVFRSGQPFDEILSDAAGAPPAPAHAPMPAPQWSPAMVQAA